MQALSDSRRHDVNTLTSDRGSGDIKPVPKSTAASAAQQQKLTAGPAQVAVHQPLARAVDLVANSFYCNNSPDATDLPLGAQLAIAICQTANALQRENPTPVPTKQLKTSTPASCTDPTLTHSITNEQRVTCHPSPAVQQPTPATDTSDCVTSQTSSRPDLLPHKTAPRASLGSSSTVQQQCQEHMPIPRQDSSELDVAYVQVSCLHCRSRWRLRYRVAAADAST